MKVYLYTDIYKIAVKHKSNIELLFSSILITALGNKAYTIYTTCVMMQIIWIMIIVATTIHMSNKFAFEEY